MPSCMPSCTEAWLSALNKALCFVVSSWYAAYVWCMQLHNFTGTNRTKTAYVHALCASLLCIIGACFLARAASVLLCPSAAVCVMPYVDSCLAPAPFVPAVSRPPPPSGASQVRSRALSLALSLSLSFSLVSLPRSHYPCHCKLIQAWFQTYNALG